MTPIEALPGGERPSLQWLRVWGCKTYVLKPKAERRKDWEDKAQVGYFVGYSENQQGWEIFLPASDKFVTTVHVLFDEKPPARSDDYFRELDEAALVFKGAVSKSVHDYTYLKKMYHIDNEDELLYVITRVEVIKGFILGYRSQVTAERQKIEDKTPIHTAYIKKMTAATQKKALQYQGEALTTLHRPHQ